jgi:hypothetical protein
MKRLLLLVLLSSIPAFGQCIGSAWTTSASGSTTAQGEINQKPAFQSCPGTPASNSLACTVGHDIGINSSNGDFYTCSVTGTPGTWVKIGPGAGGSGCVPSGSAGDLLVDSGSGTCNSSADFVYTTHTIAGGASGILDLHLMGTSAFKVPGGFTTGVLHVTTSTGATAGGLVSLTADVTGVLPAANVAAALSSTTSVNGTTIPSSATLAQAVASGSSTLGTSAISSGACATVVTTTATGAATSGLGSRITATPSVDPTGVTGYGPSASGSLYVWVYPTANNVNFKVCNNTSGSITPSALTMNWIVQ